MTDEPSSELELRPDTQVTLFGSQEPAQVIEKVSEIASILKDVLRKQKLVTRIRDRDHVRVEGWTLLGTILGVFPVISKTEELRAEDGKLLGFEAHAEARTRQGEIVGAAVARCMRSENTWKSRDEYALQSMAQTRAVSKALRGPLGFVVTMAGYEATPYEEMPDEGDRTEIWSNGTEQRASKNDEDPDDQPATPAQIKAYESMYETVKGTPAPDASGMTKKQARTALQELSHAMTASKEVDYGNPYP